jgi:hypothetical protein
MCNCLYTSWTWANPIYKHISTCAFLTYLSTLELRNYDNVQEISLVKKFGSTYVVLEYGR